ncbi:MAG: DUF349 domain-containing protein [Proteobacteria bacterium]|nr:DUF349 domain-containing protein [Pseudomonadota bacterium]
MGFTDLFRPRHRHSNAAVRADAVRQMGSDEADLVASIARHDRDVSVRRIALDKLDDPELLVEIARDEADRGLRERANRRAADIWVARAVAASDLAEAERSLAGLTRIDDQKAVAEVASRAESAEVRGSALAKIRDPRALAELARNPSTPMVTRTTAIARIDDPEVLRSIAIDEKRKDVALAVLDRISDESALEVIVGKAKNKAVRTRARRKLAEQARAAIEVVAPEVKRKHAERVQLVRRAEKLARGDEWVASAGEMDVIERSWHDLGDHGDDPELETRFHRSRDRYHKRRQAHVDMAARKAAADAARAGHSETARGGEKDGDRGADLDTRDRAGTAVEPAREAQPGGEANELGVEGEAAVTDDSRILDEQREDGQKKPDEQKRNEQKQRLEERKRQQRARQERDLDALRKLNQDMEKQLDSGKRKQAERLLQKADKTFENLKLPDSGGQELSRYRELRQKLFIRVQELREADAWQRWSNVPRQEGLIEKARALLTVEDDSNLAEQLKILQAEWKRTGPVPHNKSQELWNAFKSTCDEVYARVKGARARMAEQQVHNLTVKRELCERVEALAESTDWDQTADEIKGLQREWRTIGSVPRKHSDAIWKRFRAACDLFFERRKPYLEELMAERTQNLQQKVELCERAEALAESTEWKQTAAELRTLQRDWRDIGPVPRKDANAINKRFRAACDRFFERRQNQRDREKTERQQKLADIAAEIDTLIELVERGESVIAGEPASDDGTGRQAGEGEGAEGAEGAETGADAAQRALRVRATLRDLALEGRELHTLYEQASRLYRVILDRTPDAFDGTELDPRTSQQKKEKLLLRAEEMAPGPQLSAPEPSQQSPEQLAETLRAALAHNALSASLAQSTDGRNLADNIAVLEDSWVRVGPVPGEHGESLETRFSAACERAMRLAGVDPRQRNKPARSPHTGRPADRGSDSSPVSGDSTNPSHVDKNSAAKGLAGR